jgi:hypothetical protein
MYLQTREYQKGLQDDHAALRVQLAATTDREARRDIWQKITAIAQERQRLNPPVTKPLH